ncbi:MAG: glycosyltransferase, partial [Bacteroidota bacterium]
MQSELISILVPFKNTSKFIDECVESILAQTHTNWELLIVNDHSSDTSYNQVLAYAEKDKRIKLFQNEDHGIIPALRKAYFESTGNFITRMDSDDLMHPKKLELMLKDLKTHGNKHVALGQVSYFSDDGIGQGYKAYENWLNSLTKNGTNYNDIYKECVIPSPCWMMRKNDLDLCQAFNPNSYPEDYDLTFRFYENKMRCIPSNHVLH